MLQIIREKIQGWVAVMIASALCLAFALWGIEYYITNTPDQITIAEVNGQDITQSQLEIAYERVRQAEQVQIADPRLNEAYQNQIKKNVLNALIQEQVLTRAAQKLGYVMSPAQISAIIQQIPAFQVNGQFSFDLFQRALMNLSFTTEQFFQSAGQSALLNQVKQSMAQSNFVLPSEVDQQIILLNEKRSFGYMLVPTASFLNAASVSSNLADQVEKYYQAHTQDFLNPEQVSLQYLLLSTAEASKKVTVTDQEVSQYYTENKAAFVKPNTTESLPLSAVKSQIEKMLKQQKMEHWIANQSETLSNLTYTHPDNLSAAAAALNLPVQTTGFFTQTAQNTPKIGLLANPKVLAAAFSDNVLKQGNNSDVININNDTVVVIRVAERKPASVKPLSEVRASIEKDLRLQIAVQEATRVGEKIRQALAQGASVAALAKQYKLQWIEKKEINRQSKNPSSEIVNLVFAQSAPVSDKKPVVGSTPLKNGDYVITQLTAVIPGVLTSINAAARQNLQQQMAMMFGMLDYDLYVGQQMNSAKIKFKEE